MNHTTNRRKFIAQGTLLVALALVSWLSSIAAEKAAVRAPDKTPARIVLTWAGDPTRSQAVTWRTDTLVTGPRAQIAPLTPSPKVEASALTVKGTATAVALPEGKSAAQYAVRFQDLKPGTKYTYRVGDGSTWSEWNVFQTAGTRPEPFRFLYVGDAQNDIRSLWSRAIRAAYATAPDARFIVHAGDLVADGYNDRLWGEWCEALSFISAMVPSLPVPGNHDLHRSPDSSDDASGPLVAPPSWRQQFALPMNGPEGLRGQSYYIDYQGVRMISLDVNIYAGKQDTEAKKQLAQQQTAWLEKVLGENPNRWTIVFQHQPVYSIAKNRRATQMQAMLAPLYDKYQVDLVLAGHDHGYGRTQKVRAGQVVPGDGPGTIYAISVSGPKMYELTPEHPELMAKILAGVQLFQIISINGERLAYQAYTIDGSVIDSFELRKSQARSGGGK